MFWNIENILKFAKKIDDVTGIKAGNSFIWETKICRYTRFRGAIWNLRQNECWVMYSNPWNFLVAKIPERFDEKMEFLTDYNPLWFVEHVVIEVVQPCRESRVGSHLSHLHIVCHKIAKGKKQHFICHSLLVFRASPLIKGRGQ